jgi:hypothetical protein
MRHYTNTDNPIDFPKLEVDMNERILKLALDAGLLNYVDNETPRRYFVNGYADLEEVEKFAELIVKECIDKITTYDLVPGHSAKWEDIYDIYIDDIHARLLQDLGEELKEHFGVEE